MALLLSQVLQSYWHSLKNSAGTLLVLAIWIIMFAIIGLDFFGGCKYDRYHINGQTNFDTIQSSLELMFRISVGGDYVGVADSISIQVSDILHVVGNTDLRSLSGDTRQRG